MTLDSTTGGASANSYISLADAQTYFDGRFDVAEWTAAASATQTVALQMATARLEQERFVGMPSTDTQRLQWPRFGVPESNGSGEDYDSDEMPSPLLAATCELALALLKDTTLLSDSGLEGFERVVVGSLDVTPRSGRAGGTLPAQVQRLLMGLRLGSSIAADVVRG